MRTRRSFSALLAGASLLSMAYSNPCSWAFPGGQSFAGTNALPGLDSSARSIAIGEPAASDSPDSTLFTEGTRAINESRWADAVRIFAQAAAERGEHADGALYWKAYAEDKLNQAKEAEDTCAALRGSYPKSPWIEDCGALQVEIRSKTGKRIELDPNQSDDVKLLQLNAMMRQDEPRALAEIQGILNGDASERLKKEAQFILGQHYSDTTYPQIVRISYVEGDVRIQRGAPTGKAESTLWEQAVVDLPLESGFSLVTGTGRAEVEFENASTLYLGENSVMAFNDLHTTAGVPYTDLALLSGTVSLHIHPYVAGELFILRTLTENLLSKYPDKSYVRLESYTNGLAVTPLEGGGLRLPGFSKDAAKDGLTYTYRDGQLEDAEGRQSDVAFSDWDAWVATRVAQRDAAIATVMEASGLSTPIPGMANLAGQGTFFDCAPYGTCWEPNGVAESGDETARWEPKEGSMGNRPRLLLASFHPQSVRPQAMQSASQGASVQRELHASFPCMPDVLRYRQIKDPVTGKQTISSTAFAQTEPYDWAVCHAGTWVRHKKHYAWVAGTKRHHIDPVRWIKCDHRIAFVPLHPYDVKGQPAINIKHEVFEVSGKIDIAVHPVKLEPNRPVDFLSAPPKEYRVAPLQPLAHLEAPRMEARALGTLTGIKSGASSRASIPVRFDPKSLSFTMPRQEIHGGKPATVFTPMTNRNGTLQARGEGFHGGSGSGGNSHGGANSGSPSGAHNGGSSSASGASSHSGGGSTTSTSSSSSSSTSSSGGGSHH